MPGEVRHFRAEAQVEPIWIEDGGERLRSEVTERYESTVGAIFPHTDEMMTHEMGRGLIADGRMTCGALFWYIHGGLIHASEKLQEVLGWILNDNTRTMLAGRAALERDPELDGATLRATDASAPERSLDHTKPPSGEKYWR